MTTVGSAIDETLNEWLLTAYRPMYNALGSPVDSAATNLVLAYPLDGVGSGSIVGIDSELMQVVGANQTSSALTVVRGIRGTTAASHGAATAVEINPRFPRVAIKSAMRKEILSWPNDLYRRAEIDVGVAAGQWSIDLATAAGVTTITRIINVRGVDPAHTDRWPSLGRWRPVFGEEGAGSARILLSQPVGSVTTVKVTYGRGFDVSTFEEITDLNATVGLSDSQVEIVELGAAWRLVSARETKRLLTEAQPESRRAEEVPVQANATWGLRLRQLRDIRIADEVKRLRDTVGLRVS